MACGWNITTGTGTVLVIFHDNTMVRRSDSTFEGAAPAGTRRNHGVRVSRYAYGVPLYYKYGLFEARARVPPALIDARAVLPTEHRRRPDADMPLPPTAAAQALASLWLLSSAAAGAAGSEASASYVADAPASCPANPPAAQTAKAGTPNLVLILTDDMDLALGGFTPLKKTAKLLSQRGSTASNYFIRALA